MGEGGDRPRFLLEAAEPVRMASELRRQHLDRHVPAEPLVTRPPDSPMPPAPIARRPHTARAGYPGSCDWISRLQLYGGRGCGSRSG